MTLYQRLEEEFEAMEPIPSIQSYSTTIYEGKPELEKIYEAGYFDGIDVKTGRNYPGDSAPNEQRMAYAHGLLTGTEEFWNDIGE